MRSKCASSIFTSGPEVTFLPEVETESLHNFQSFRPCLVRAPNLIRLPARVVRPVEVVPSGFREDQEPVRVSPLKALNGLLETLSMVAGEVHHHADIFLVHHRQHLFRSREEPDLLPDGHAILVLRPHGEVGMHIDNGEPRAFHLRFRHVQHAPGLEVLERQAFRLCALRPFG